MPNRVYNRDDDDTTNSALSRKSSKKHMKLGYGISPATAGSKQSLQMSKIGGRTTTNSQLSKRGSSCSTAFATRMQRRGMNAPANFDQRHRKYHYKDTNAIYPPNQAYDKANNELKSPQKRRPQSGGQSPDKGRIDVDDDHSPIDQLSASIFRDSQGGSATYKSKKGKNKEPRFLCDDKVKFEAAIKKAYHEHRETQLALQQAQAKIVDTRN